MQQDIWYDILNAEENNAVTNETQEVNIENDTNIWRNDDSLVNLFVPNKRLVQDDE